MSNFEIEEIPMNEPQAKCVSNDTKKETDLNNVVQLEAPIQQCNVNENIDQNIEHNIVDNLENDVESFQIQTECKGHKFFGNITKTRIQPTKKANDSNLGLYLISGAIVATLGAKLI